MRKALIGLVLAATVMTPFAAQAQDWRQRNADGGEERAARVEQRHQQREARQAEQQAQPQQQARPQQVQQEAPRQQYQRRQYQPQQQQQQFEQQVQRQQYQRQQIEQQQQQQAYGQRQRYDGNRGNWRGNQNNQGSIYPQAWQGDPNDPRLRRYQELERRNQQGYNNDRGNWRDNRNDRGDWRGNRNGQNDWNRNWRNDNRYDWQRYRYSNRNQFRVGPYYSPYRNYGYNRFSIGGFLDSLFFDQRYWIGDPWQYRLPPAYPGTQWVRYYNDVILVDVYSGEVIDVIYDFFW